MSMQEVLEAVRHMTPAERAQVRALLDELPTAATAAEETAQVKLREAGFLAKPAARVPRARPRHSPVEINGKPLSETVIEERG